MRSFDADLPVMDSAIATITEDGPIYRGVNCVDLAERDTLEHAATLLWDVTGVDPFTSDNCPSISGEMRAVADAARRATPIDRAIAVLALAASADPRRLHRAPTKVARWSAAASCASWWRRCSTRRHPQNPFICRSRGPGRLITSTLPI